MIRLLCACLALGWALAAPAAAHERATARIDLPAEGAVVTGDTVEVVLRASASGTPAEFRLLLDGRPVDETGAVGGGALFTTFRMPPGTSKRLLLRLASAGPHTLRLEPTPHADRPEPPIVRGFSSRAAPTASPTPTAHHGGDGDDHTVHFATVGGVLVAGAAAAVYYARKGRQPAP